MLLEAFTFPVINLSDETFRISEEEILADLLYPAAEARPEPRR